MMQDYEMITLPTVLPHFQLDISPISVFAAQSNSRTTAFLPIDFPNPLIMSQSEWLGSPVANINTQAMVSQHYEGLYNMLAPPFPLVMSAAQMSLNTPIVEQGLTMKEIEQLLVLKYQMEQEGQKINIA